MLSSPIQSKRVSRAFDCFPESIQSELLFLRKLILSTASQTDGVGPLEESLKRGLPAYSPRTTNSGLPVRIGPIRDRPGYYALFFNSQTDLVQTFRTRFAGLFEFEGTHAIAFKAGDEIPVDAVNSCIRSALTYYLREEIEL